MLRVRVRCVRHEVRAFECTHSWSPMQVLLLCNYTLQLLSSFSSFEESTNVPSIFASGSVRSLVGTLMAASPHRASPGGAGGPAPRPPAAAPRARVVLPSWAQGKELVFHLPLMSGG